MQKAKESKFDGSRKGATSNTKAPVKTPIEVHPKEVAARSRLLLGINKLKNKIRELIYSINDVNPTEPG